MSKILTTVYCAVIFCVPQLIFSMSSHGKSSDSQTESMSCYFRGNSYFGNSVISNQNISSVGFYLIPNLCHHRNGLFIQAENYFLYDGEWIRSTGVGLRTLDSIWDFVWGVNVFYNTRKTAIGRLDQLTGGIEVLTPFFEFRINKYTPIKQSGIFGNPILFDDYVGDYSVLITQQDFLINAWDVLISNLTELAPNISAYSGFGGYYLSIDNPGAVCGFQCFSELWWMSYLYLGIYYTTDKIFGSLAEMYMGVSIPLKRISDNSYCDCGGYLNGHNGRTARLTHLGEASTLSHTCCHYKTYGF